MRLGPYSQGEGVLCGFLVSVFMFIFMENETLSCSASCDWMRCTAEEWKDTLFKESTFCLRKIEIILVFCCWEKTPITKTTLIKESVYLGAYLQFQGFCPLQLR